MIAVTRYWISVLLHSQRYFPPLVLFIVGVVVLTANDLGPLTAAYGSCSAVLFLSAMWLSVCLVNADDPVQRAVTVVNARSPARVLAGSVVAAVLALLAAEMFGLGFPLLSGHHRVTAAAVAAGAGAQFCATLTGIGLGLVCSRLVVRRPAMSLAAGILLAIAAFAAVDVSPIGAVLRVMSSDRTPRQLLAPVGGLTIAAAALLAVLAAACHVVSVRRQ